MARSFSDDEKRRIRTNLIEKGRELFARFGVRKTSIDELAAGAGIAKGSFYAFFTSKEELYLEIHEHDEDSLRAQYMERYFADGFSRQNLKDFLLGAAQLMETHPLLKQMMDKNEMEYLRRKIPEERMNAHAAEDFLWLTGLVEEWQSQGKMVQMPSAVVASSIGALFFLTLHKQDLGQLYRPTLTLWAEALSQKLCP